MSTDLAPAEAARSAALKLKSWALDEALPLWSSAGFDPRWGGFHERLTYDGTPIEAAPRRLMVQARQIYVYAHADLLGWRPDYDQRVAQTVDTMVKKFLRVDGKPGFVHSVNADGTVADPKRDAYAYAFVLFGLAWALRRGPDARMLALVEETIADLDTQFAIHGGGYLTELPVRSHERLQNPHMHLMEAFLALFESTQDGRFLARAGAIFDLFKAHFFAYQPPVLVEYFDNRWQPAAGQRGRLWEPGHQFEWAWLLRCFARLGGGDTSRYIGLLHERAWSSGRDAAGLVVDECDAASGHTKGSRRCWPQTEALKSLSVEAEVGDEAVAAECSKNATILVENLERIFLATPTPGGWIDHVDANGTKLAASMPASTLYHIFLAIAELNRVFVTPQAQ